MNEWSEVARWEMWENSEVKKLCCIAPGRRNIYVDSLQRFDNSYIMFWII